MELVSVIKARSIWLFDINDLNPRGKNLDELLKWLKNSYGFEKAPESLKDVEKDTNALAFTNGRFQVREDFFIDVDLRIYNDGLVADTRSATQDSDAFLTDVLSSAAREFSLVYRPEIVHSRLHSSELNVRCDLPLANLNPKFQAFAEKLSRMAKPVPMQLSFSLSGLTFWDSTTALQGNPTTFKFERKLKVPFSENRYYSLAPVHTHEHLELLNDLEAIISGLAAEPR